MSTRQPAGNSGKKLNAFEVMQLGTLDDMVLKLGEQVAVLNNQVVALRELKDSYETLVKTFEESNEKTGTFVKTFEESNEKTGTFITNLDPLVKNLETVAAYVGRTTLLAEHQTALKIAPRIKIYEYGTVPANDELTLFEEDIATAEDGRWSTEFMFIITHVANSTGRTGETGGWYDNTRAIWKRDYDIAAKARSAEEEITYQYSTIEIPLEVSPWVPIFYNHKWTVHNGNAFDIAAEVLMEGLVFPTWLWQQVTERFFR